MFTSLEIVFVHWILFLEFNSDVMFDILQFLLDWLVIDPKIKMFELIGHVVVLFTGFGDWLALINAWLYMF